MLVLIAILSLGVLIIVHEGGHFVMARLCNMRVPRFSIGFGPPLVKFKRGGTTYQIAWIPLGAYVQIAGLNPHEEGNDPNDPNSYPNRPVYARLLAIFAGPGANYLFAALMMTAISIGFGVAVPGKMPQVGELIEGKPAKAAGLQLGDEIVSVNGQAVKDMGDVAPIIDASKGEPVKIAVVREREQIVYSIKPDQVDGKWRIGIGIWPKQIRERQPIGKALVAGLRFPYDVSAGIIHGFAEIFRGHQKAEFSGPVGIVVAMKRQIAKGPDYALEIMAIISVYLGLFNLLPIPALDGGRLVFLIVEGLSRRRVNHRTEQTIHMVGFVILLGLLVVVTGKDILNLVRSALGKAS